MTNRDAPAVAPSHTDPHADGVHPDHDQHTSTDHAVNGHHDAGGP